MKFPLPILILAKGLADAIAPARCISCLHEGTWYCQTCRTLPMPHTLTCVICKQERFHGTTCTSCIEDTPLTGLVSAGTYSDKALQRGIEWLKFKGVRPIADILAALLIPRLSSIAPYSELSRSAALIPLPLHPQREKSRGFNQSKDIATAMGRICNIPVLDLLTRDVATSSQATLPHLLRAENMQSAFSRAISNKEYETVVHTRPILILVDDVCTTSTTLSSAAQALSYTDIRIWGAVVARG